MTEEARTIVGKFRCAETELKEVGAAYFEEDDFGSAADLIESLSAQLDQVTRERDAAVSDFTEYANSAAICAFCKDFEFDKPCDKDIRREDCWQWRGVEVEG